MSRLTKTIKSRRQSVSRSRNSKILTSSEILLVEQLFIVQIHQDVGDVEGAIEESGIEKGSLGEVLDLGRKVSLI